MKEQIKSLPVHRTETEKSNNSINQAPKTFLNEINYIVYLLKLTGLLPFFDYVSNYGVGASSKFKNLYTITAHAFVHSATIYNIFNLFSEGSTQLFYSYRETDNINYWIEIFLCIVTYTTTVLVCFKNSTSFIRIINEILQVDEEISREFNVNIFNTCGFAGKFILLIVLLQWYIIILKILRINEPLTVPSYFLIGFYSVQNGLSSVFIVYTSILLRIVMARFQYINFIISSYSYQYVGKVKQQSRSSYQTQSSGSVPPRTTAIERFQNDSLFVFRIFNKLLHLYKLINETCSLILVVYMGYSFYSITTTTYNLFVQITTQRGMSLIVLQICFALLFLHTAMMTLLSRCAAQATDQANETSKILARVYVKCKVEQNIIEKFLTKSIKQDAQFTAYGFFVIDNATLFKIFSAVTTYLVILIQFRQLEESKTDRIEASAL